MRVVANYRGEEIVLKKYTSYLELDKDLSSFDSSEELMGKMGFDPSIDDSITVLDNNGKPIDYDFKAARETLSFYEQRKGDEFVRWIFYSARNNYHNKKKLIAFFDDRVLDFTKNNSNFDESSISNSEGKRLYSVIKNVRKSLNMFGLNTSTLDMGKSEILRNLEDYVKKDGSYDYAYMRKLACSLSKNYKYNFDKPKVQIEQVSEKEKDKIVYTFNTAIYNYGYPKRQVTLDELTSEEIMPTSVYDENGEKIDEIPFHQETMAKNLHL